MHVAVVVLVLLASLVSRSASGDATISEIRELDRAAQALIDSAERVPGRLMRLRALAAARAKYEKRQDLTSQVVEARAIPRPSYDPLALDAKLHAAVAALLLGVEVNGPSEGEVEAVVAAALGERGYQPQTGLEPQNTQSLDAVVHLECRVEELGEFRPRPDRPPLYRFAAAATIRVVDNKGNVAGAFKEKYTVGVRDPASGEKEAIAQLIRRLREKSMETADRIIKARPPK